MTSKIIFGLIGAGGLGRGVMPFARELVKSRFASDDTIVEIYFVETSPTLDSAYGTRLLSEDEFASLSCDEKYFNVAINDSKVREEIALRTKARGIQPLSLQAPNTLIYDNNELGEGHILCPFSMI